MQRMSSKDEQLLRASILFDGQCHQIKQDDCSLLASDEVRTHLKQWSLIGSALRHELPSKIDPAFASKVMARIETINPTSSQQEDKDELPSMLTSKSAFRADLASYARSQHQATNVGAYEAEQAVGAYESKAVGAYETSNVGAYEAEQSVGAYETSVEHKQSHISTDANEMEDQPLEIIQEPVVAPKTSKLKRLYVFTSQVAIAASIALIAVVGLQTYNASDVVEEGDISTAYLNANPVGGLSLASYQNADNDMSLQFNGQLPISQAYDTNNKSHEELQLQQVQEIDRINLYVKGYVFDTAENN